VKELNKPKLDKEITLFTRYGFSKEEIKIDCENVFYFHNDKEVCSFKTSELSILYFKSANLYSKGELSVFHCGMGKIVTFTFNNDETKLYENIYDYLKEVCKVKLFSRNELLQLTVGADGHLYSRKTKRCCPKCGSENCHAFVDTVQISSGKTKTRYTANLNPLKPFTLLNKKETVVRNPYSVNVSKFQCDNCGKVFS